MSPVGGGQEVTMQVTGNGFLYRMVRMLAAGLVEVGHRRLSPQGLQQLLEGADRTALPEAAPPHGLYLQAVHYKGDPDFESRAQALGQRIRAGNAGRAHGPAAAGAGAAGTAGTGGVAVAEADVQAGALEAEAESVVQELQQSQGQKAAVAMKAAAIARRRSSSGSSGGEGGGDDAGTGGGREGGGDEVAGVAGAAGSGGGDEGDAGAEDADLGVAVDFAALREQYIEYQ
ncbi:tRNA pseudouridine synthase A, partial [Tetrabaena socialis]